MVVMMDENQKKNKEEISTNIFEQFLKGLTLKFDPKTFTLTVGYPSSPVKEDKVTEAINVNNPAIKAVSSSQSSDKAVNHALNIAQRGAERKPPTISNNISKVNDNLEYMDMDLDKDLKRDIEDFGVLEQEEPVRVKIQFKAYIKMALHALKYANSKIRKDKWVEIIGLLTGYIENKDNPLTCLVITDAYPIGHGTNVNAWIRNPQSHVKVYQKLKGEIILGWYHSHPGYSPFMSKTDYQTQVRYQKLGSKSPYEAPIALVLDHTQISKKSYGFKIFRLDTKLRKWENPKYEVIDCPLDSLPNMLKTLLPLTEGKGLFLEYDHM